MSLKSRCAAIPISDSKEYMGPLDMLKRGGVDGVANNRARDSSNAILRRIRVFTAVIKERQTLLNFVDGPLSVELPVIFNWVLEANPCDSYLQHTEILSKLLKETAENINPILQWVRDELTSGTGSVCN